MGLAPAPEILPQAGGRPGGRFWKTSLARICWCYFLCLCLVVCGCFLCFSLCFFCVYVWQFVLFFVLFAVLFFVSVFRSLCFFSCAVPCAFFCGYVCAFLFVFFQCVLLHFSRKSCLAVCGFFFVLSGVLFFVPVFGSLWFFLFFVVFFLLACLLVCVFFCAFMFSSRLGKSSLVSDLLCLCPTSVGLPAGCLYSPSTLETVTHLSLSGS